MKLNLDPKYLENLALRELEEDTLDMAHPEDARSSELAELESAGSSTKLALVVGHTNRSQGAVGVNPLDKSEYLWNDELAGIVRQIAIGRGVNCKIFYRDGIGISGAYAQVKSWGANTCVELHFNAAETDAYGTETLHGVLDSSNELAATIQHDMLSSLSREINHNRGIKLRVDGERGGRSLSQLTDIPSVIVEPFFGHVKPEATLGVERRLQYAEGLVRSHLRFMTSFA